jgi:hypothetical protein
MARTRSMIAVNGRQVCRECNKPLRWEWLIVIETLGAVAKVARRCGAVSEDIQHIQYIQEPLSHAVCS